MKDRLKELLGAETNPLAKRNMIREYLQARMLQFIQESGGFLSWAFLGGTALRFLYGLPRFSEDLDFSLHPGRDLVAFDKVVRNIERGFSDENYPIDVKSSERRTVNSALFRFPGLLFEMGLSPRRQEIFSIKLEVDTNPPSGAVIETSLVRRHVTLRISHYDKASLLAGKLHAILSRPWLKGRDVYDLVWYLADPAWPNPNLAFLNQALRQTGWEGSDLTEKSWRRIVLDRLKKADWKTTVQDVRPFLERATETDLIDFEACRRLLRV